MSDTSKDSRPPKDQRPPPQGADADRPALVGVTVEVCEDNNRNYLWGPTGQRLRGRWDGHNLNGGDASEAGLRKMPVIPGMHISVLPRQRTCRVDDPLADPSAQPLLMEINRVYYPIFKVQRTPVESVVRTDCTDSDMASWLALLMRAVKSGLGRVIDGELPRDEAELMRAFPGATIRRSYFDNVEAAARGALAEMSR
jgi:hypothetical protein